jgi:diguanylate cyclase (GGDEF)-like protein/PAS domain S-box-containing protein
MSAPAGAGARALIELLPAIVYVSEVGVYGRWLYVSGQAEAILGFSPDEWTGDNELWASRVHADDRERVFARETLLEDPHAPEEYRMLHRDGRTVWIRDHAALVSDEQGNQRWHGVMSDITSRKAIETALERQASQQAAVARLGSHALEGVELGELMNQAVVAVTDILDVDAAAILELIPEGEPALVRAGSWLPEHAPDEEGAPAAPNSELECTIEGIASPWGTLCVQSRDPREYSSADVDFVHAIANVLADAIQRRFTEDGIRSQALHDPLTGLPNRVLALDRLEQARLRPGGRVAVLLLDVDRFKLVNDSLGHAAGDELLCEIAPRLREVLRPSDTIGRLGGDEFVVLLEEVADEQAAIQVAERIVAAFARPFLLEHGECHASASIGIAIATSGCEVSETLIRDADAALYLAKERGRARYEVFDRAMRARTIARLSVESDLRRALDRGELRLAYQPVVSLIDDSTPSIEALVRWQHPQRGLLMPGEFISVAEETGLIGPIGEWVLLQAARHASELTVIAPDAPPVGVSVNLSARELTQRAFARTVAKVLEVTGLEPMRLHLEITESVLLDESSLVDQTMEALSTLGVRIVLDDFGTSYSSLGCLTRLPIAGLKIHSSFIQGLSPGSRSTAIVTAIIRMAQALSIDVVAEGVETALQAQQLRLLGCEQAQGFYFARPMAFEQMVTVLARHGQAQPRHTTPV